jgi:hypothetical protein
MVVVVRSFTDPDDDCRCSRGRATALEFFPKP